jgi:acetate---CoA ligase (ADP-forming)
LPTGLAHDSNEALHYADQMGYPVVMKIVSPEIIHKTEAGGVKIDIKNADEAVKAFDEIIANAKRYKPSAYIEGVLVLKMAAPGEEMILGMKRYPGFGPLLMFGTGGIYVEIFKDVVFRLAPIGRNNARRMVRGIKAAPLLEGYRGKRRADTEIIEKYLVSLSNLVMNHPEITELDINPLLVHEEGRGATVADVRIMLTEPDNPSADGWTCDCE